MMDVRTPRLALVLTVAALVTGCGPGTPKRTITANEAVRKMDGFLQETMRAVPTRLEFADRRVDTEYTGSCTKGLGLSNNFTGQIKPDLEYAARISPSDADEVDRYIEAAVAAYWSGKSAEVDKSDPDILAIHPYRDDYRLTVARYPAQVNLGGVLDDCIWKYGTPQPDDDP